METLFCTFTFFPIRTPADNHGVLTENAALPYYSISENMGKMPDLGSGPNLSTFINDRRCVCEIILHAFSSCICACSRTLITARAFADPLSVSLESGCNK